MQNWDHVLELLKQSINQQLQHHSDNSTDFSRVRRYFLDDKGSRFRQVILSSQFCHASFLSCMKRFGQSHAGMARLQRRTSGDQASISQVVVPIQQVFFRVSAKTFTEQGQARLEYFKRHVLPKLFQQSHTMIYIPSYFDFVWIRNVLLKKQEDDDDVEFVSVAEYSRVSEVSQRSTACHLFWIARTCIFLFGNCEFHK